MNNYNAERSIQNANNPAAKKAMTEQEICDIKADLENIISRAHTLSKTDLAQAKEQFIQKIVFARRRAKSMPNVKEVDLNIKSVSEFVKKYPIQSIIYPVLAGLVISTLYVRTSHQFLPCSEPNCCVWPRCWCDEYTDQEGKRHSARCSKPWSRRYCCKNPDQNPNDCSYGT
ncbi:MAG: hypothetical protein K0S36_1446 [Nitrosospira multiformis]|nr:hypothetical protein [Nitrosospira multiformis]